ncbi:MAG: hypothetical protein IPO29_02350 [Anaerolineae bacterium]|nr:hypothetical protein [Anaerolineae bacterium]
MFWSFFNGPVTIGVGVLIWRRVRGNAVGPLLILWGVQTALWAVPIAELRAVTSIHTLSIGVLSLVYLFIYFPSGQPYPARADRFYAASFVGLLINGILFVLSHPTFRTVAVRLPDQHFLYVADLAPLQSITEAVCFLSLGLWLWGPLTLVLRYRTSSDQEKVQIKWLAFLALVMIPIAAALIIANSLIQSDPPPLYESALGVIYTSFQIGPTIIIGISILRHRLWNIDVLIRRTVTYTLASGALATIYFGANVIAQGVIGALGGQRNEVAIVASTLAVAALFSPVRRRVQNAIDRRFNRQRYDADKVVADFAEMPRTRPTWQLCRLASSAWSPRPSSRSR